MCYHCYGIALIVRVGVSKKFLIVYNRSSYKFSFCHDQACILEGGLGVQSLLDIFGKLIKTFYGHL